MSTYYEGLEGDDTLNRPRILRWPLAFDLKSTEVILPHPAAQGDISKTESFLEGPVHDERLWMSEASAVYYPAPGNAFTGE